MGDQVVGGQQDRAALVVEKTVSEGLWPGRCSTRRVRSREHQLLAVGERPRDLHRRAPGAEARRDRAQRGHDFAGDAVAQHDPLGEGVVEVGLVP